MGLYHVLLWEKNLWYVLTSIFWTAGQNAMQSLLLKTTFKVFY